MGFSFDIPKTGIQIIDDFSESLNQIFGGSDNAGRVLNKGGEVPKLFDRKYGGATGIAPANWVGNSTSTNKVRYGFSALSSAAIKGNNDPRKALWPEKDQSVFYLQIPPQSIVQKEVFANNIQATRRGVIVESEGVVFKEIILKGTTGVFPGIRGSANTPVANTTNPTQAPRGPQGVSPDTGRSRASGVAVISGYEEFLRLRQFFLRYAKTKLDTDGDLFLIWINEKDGETLVVEPMDFTMDRSSKSPLTYNYTITLKAIGNLNSVFGYTDQQNLSFFQKAVNVAANLSAGIQQGRAVINQSTRLLQRISQTVDQTVIGPLRQIQYASEDFASGVATVLSLPSILARNWSSAVGNIRDSLNSINTSSKSSSAVFKSQEDSAKKIRNDILTSSSDRATEAANLSFETQVKDKIANDSRVIMPKNFIAEAKTNTMSLANNLSDFVNMGDSGYDAIKNRTPTIKADTLKAVSDDEFILLGTLHNIADLYNNALATNILFQTDSDVAFEQARKPFESENLPEDFQLTMNSPKQVKEVLINSNDTLERIAQRELGDATRWIEIVVLNQLKPPYISLTGGDGIKKYGDKILIGVS